MKNIKWIFNEPLPMEMHKARIVQKINLLEPKKRLEAIKEAGFNTFLLKNHDVFLDMLTDSGVNAMSDKQQAAMLQADDSYAGSETFFKLFKASSGKVILAHISTAIVKISSSLLSKFHFFEIISFITHSGFFAVNFVISTQTISPLRAQKAFVEATKISFFMFSFFGITNQKLPFDC